MLRNSVSPTGKFGFHMKNMAGPTPQHNDGWSDSMGRDLPQPTWPSFLMKTPNATPRGRRLKW
jgi:hypothetical protein